VSRFQGFSRRLLSVAAATTLGVIGVLVLASPASAHYTEVSGVASCDTAKGEWGITWTVASKLHYNSNKFEFRSVNAKHGSGPAPAGSTSPGVPFDRTTFALNTYADPWHPFTGVQTFVDGAATWASIEIQSHWNDGYADTKPTKGIVALAGGCRKNQPAPMVSYQSTCDGTVLVTLRNDGGTAPAVFLVTGVAGTTTVAPNATRAPLTIPAGTGHVTVSASGKKIGPGYDFKAPANCAPVKLSSKVDCTTLTVQLENPEGPATSYKVVSGPTSLVGTLAAGESKTLPALAAKAGTTAVVTIGQLEPTTIPWASQPACAPASPPALALTGSKLTPVVGVGAALLVGGVGLIAAPLLHRRRRRTTAAGS
jgi:hypothetical protein